MKRNRKNGIDKKLYERIHYWLRKRYGNANKCESPDCEKKSNYFNWALLNDKKYDFNRRNFIQLCKSCHTKYDFTDEVKKEISKGLRRFHKKNPIPPGSRIWAERKITLCVECNKKIIHYKSAKRVVCSIPCRIEMHRKIMSRIMGKIMKGNKNALKYGKTN